MMSSPSIFEKPARLTLILIGLLLSSCATMTSGDRYYSLLLAADDAPVAASSVTLDPALRPVRVGLPAYLNQPALVLQRGEFEILVANHHFWAEPLDRAIAAVIAREIGASLHQSRCNLELNFSSFQATDQFVAQSRGHYSLGGEGQRVQHEFIVERQLTEDGYAHAVLVLRGLLGDISAQIASQVAERSTCAG